MKAPITLLTVVVLCALSLAWSPVGRIGKATADRAGKASRVRAVASTTASPARSDWRLGSPSSYKNLTVFPVIADNSTASADFITLDQGLRSGKVIITELGADGQSRTTAQRQSGGGAEVNRLALTNTSGKPLVLIAGEMILGGKQDRIVGHDCIIESAIAPVPLDVFCVEHGRWSGNATFGQNGGAGSGAGAGQSSGGMTAAPMALPNIREKAQAKKDQGQVWSEVAKAERANGVSSTTGTLNKVYGDKEVTAKLAAFDKGLGASLTGKNIVGAVVAIDGKIVSADVFANAALFQAYWPKLLKSYALQAVSSDQSGNHQVDRAAAEAFLAGANAPSSSEGKAGIYKLTERNGAADASFELESDAKTRQLVHFNRVNKK